MARQVVDYAIEFGREVEISLPFGKGYIQWRYTNGNDDWRTVGYTDGQHDGINMNSLAFQHPFDKQTVMIKVLMYAFTTPAKKDESYGRPYWDGWKGRFVLKDDFTIDHIPSNRPAKSLRFNEWNDAIYGSDRVIIEEDLEEDISFFDV